MLCDSVRPPPPRYELCCLVETFPNSHDSFDDFRRTLKYAYLYAKTVTLGKTHWPVTNRVMLRNRCVTGGVGLRCTRAVPTHVLDPCVCSRGLLTTQAHRLQPQRHRPVRG